MVFFIRQSQSVIQQSICTLMDCFTPSERGQHVANLIVLKLRNQQFVVVLAYLYIRLSEQTKNLSDKLFLICSQFGLPVLDIFGEFCLVLNPMNLFMLLGKFYCPGVLKRFVSLREF